MNIQDLLKKLQQGEIKIDKKSHQISNAKIERSIRQQLQFLYELTQSDDHGLVQMGKKLLFAPIEYNVPLSHFYAREQSCFGCEKRSLKMVMTEENQMTFIDWDKYYKSQNSVDGTPFTPEAYEECIAKDLIQKRTLEAEINVPSGNLIFANYFMPDVIYNDDLMEKDFPYSINSKWGRHQFMQYLAKKDVGYGQMGNMSLGIYVKNDGTEIILGDRDGWSEEKGDYDIEIEGFTYKGVVSCNVWRWQCADQDILNQYQNPLTNHRGEVLDNVLVNVQPGRWKIEHYYDFYTEEDERANKPYSKLYLINNRT